MLVVGGYIRVLVIGLPNTHRPRVAAFDLAIRPDDGRAVSRRRILGDALAVKPLRDLLDLGEEATDEEAAEKEMEEAAELLRVVLTAPQWEQVRRWKIDLETGEVLAEKKKWRDRRAELLEVVERCADLAELAGEIARLFGFTPAIFVDQAERSDDQADDQAEGPDSSGA